MQLFVAAQLRLTVYSSKDSLPLPYAHISIENNSQNFKKIIVADKNGLAIISDTMHASYNPLIVKITYTGFKNLTDTILTISKNAFSFFLHEENVFLNEFVITAQYAENSAEQAVHKIRVIDEKKIERMAAVNLRDVLTNELNVRISQDNVLGSGMSMQGISGENVKILIDGVPVIGRMNGNIDLSQINMNNVERIEIIEGPLNVNYGTNALAGTINIITKKRILEKYYVKTESYIENIGTVNQLFSLGKRINNNSFTFSAGRNFFNGWNPNDAFWPYFGKTNADSTRFKQWKPKEQYFARMSYTYSTEKFDFQVKSEYFEEKIINRGRPRKPYFETAFDDYYITKRIDNSLQLSGKMVKYSRFNFLFAYNDFSRIKNSLYKDLITLNEQLTQNYSDQDTTRFNLLNSRGTMNYIRDSSLMHVEMGYDLNVETAFAMRIKDKIQQIGDYALFVSAEMLPNRAFTIRPGFRYTYNTAYHAPLIPSVNIKYVLPFEKRGDMTVRASYAKGFRAPSIKELYLYFVDINHNILGNENLRAEYSDNFSAGITYKRIVKQTLFQTEVGSFFNNINNMISLAQTSTLGEYSYTNIGIFKTRGISFVQTISYKHVMFSAGATYTGRFNMLSESHTIPVYSWFPEIRASATYDIKMAHLSLSLFYKYNGRMPGYFLSNTNEVSETYINAFQMMDIMATQNFMKKRIALSLGCKNVLNVTNVAANISGGAHSNNSTSTPMATGRMAVCKLVLTIK